ncbi:hypothetical protein FDO65_09965 [Nakamurella flava]|uniref:DUF4175 domain-containing protein n=1 Tax=Nakamurella flava TaxID=2576308 RepID=A0A4U6QP54_9ACTN|nr:hypothetical protein [Nakamurella flava]TKV61842.1 hypothetical protein FDO65_09965 [Nakamurella flava]
MTRSVTVLADRGPVYPRWSMRKRVALMTVASAWAIFLVYAALVWAVPAVLWAAVAVPPAIRWWLLGIAVGVALVLSVRAERRQLRGRR